MGSDQRKVELKQRVTWCIVVKSPVKKLKKVTESLLMADFSLTYSTINAVYRKKEL